MVRKRVRFGEFEVPIPKGHHRITDRDETTDYLFINAPKEIYTVYFDSAMPFYSDKILSGFPEGSTLALKLPDRRIVFFCPSRDGDRKDGLWYFNIEFPTEDETEVLTLPGQVMVNSDEVYRKTVGGKLPFVEILEQIKLKLSTEDADVAVPV
ncbi:MAG: hypothetical protein IJV87_09145 [Clostridia bacterium]|nr:hypothetical protein [Clostridia bacterium]